MESGDLILLDDFCTVHKLEISFVRLLEEYGLVETVVAGNAVCVYGSELPRLEQMVRLHQELNINAEGIDAINNLLQQIESLHGAITDLRNRLSFYENNDRE